MINHPVSRSSETASTELIELWAEDPSLTFALAEGLENEPRRLRVSVENTLMKLKVLNDLFTV